MIKDELYYIFEKYRTDIFIETGTHLGYSVDRALDIGYNQIFTVEINRELYSKALDKFTHDRNVFLYFGYSVSCLEEILQRVNKKSTLWLDAHMSGISRNCPTLEEIKIIGNHKIKDHIILIDDMADFGTPAHENITIDDLKEEILNINSNYTFKFESTSKPNNVLVCEVINP